MPVTLEGPHDVWLSHYTSNRIGEGELNTILLRLIEQGIVVKVNGATRGVNNHSNDTGHADNHDDNDEADDDDGDGNADAHHSDNDVNRHDGSADKDQQADNSMTTLSWADFPDAPLALSRKKKEAAVEGAPRDTQAGYERKIFEPLKRIIDAICSTALPHLKPSCEYIVEPYGTVSEVEGSQHYIDGCLKLLKTTSPRFPKEKKKKIQTADVAVNFEFKLENIPRNVSDVCACC